MVTPQIIGKRLRTARERAGLTQAEVATVLGIAREQVSYYENGKREISLTNLMTLSNLYGYSIHHFLERESLEEEPLSIAFRTDGLNESDLEMIAWINRFIRNLRELDDLLNEDEFQ